MVHEKEHSDECDPEVVWWWEVDQGDFTGGEEVQEDEIDDMEGSVVCRKKYGVSERLYGSSLAGVSMSEHEEFGDGEDTDDEALKPISPEQGQDAPVKDQGDDDGEEVAEKEQECGGFYVL